MKRVLKISSWILFVVGAFVLLAFADRNYDEIDCQKPSIVIDKSTGHDFVTEEMILGRMSDIGYSFNNQSLGDIEVDRIEMLVKEMPGVKEVEAYKYNNGIVNVEVKQRRPIARIISKNNVVGFYLDDEGEIMPLSNHYVAKVPVFSGNINGDWNGLSVHNILSSDSLKKLYVLDDIYAIAKVLDTDEFMAAQIVQSYVNENKEIEMIPRVGNHRIMFGSGDHAELKIKKLNKFYKEVINPKELNIYDTLNVKYLNQIICSKR